MALARSIRIFPLFLLSFPAFAQDYVIANWLGDKKSATVLTYDDWSPGHGRIAIPNMVARKLVGTFFVTNENDGESGGYATMSKYLPDGIEYANHTVNHDDLTKLTADKLAFEINECTRLLDTKISGGQKTLTHAFPFGSVNQAVINEVKKTQIAGRGIYLPAGNKFLYNFAPAEDDYYKVATVTGNNSLSATAWDGWIKNGITNGGMVVLMLHSIYNASVSDNWWDAINETHFNGYLDALVQNLPQTWNATFAAAVKYHRQKKSAKLTTVRMGASDWELSLTDDLPDAIYTQPMTITLDVTAFPTLSDVTQKGKALAFTRVDATHVRFDAVPDGGPIFLYKNGVSVNPLAFIGIGDLFTVRSVAGRIVVQSSDPRAEAEITVFSLRGEALRRARLPEGAGQMVLDMAGARKGPCLVRISRGGEVVYRKAAAL